MRSLLSYVCCLNFCVLIEFLSIFQSISCNLRQHFHFPKYPSSIETSLPTKSIDHTRRDDGVGKPRKIPIAWRHKYTRINNLQRYNLPRNQSFNPCNKSAFSPMSKRQETYRPHVFFIRLPILSFRSTSSTCNLISHQILYLPLTISCLHAQTLFLFSLGMF